MRLIKDLFLQQIAKVYWLLIKTNNVLPIKRSTAGQGTVVDSFWGQKTVYAPSFFTARQTLRYLETRFREYPFFRELMKVYGNHDDHVVLEYGCGPGNDLIGFLVHANAKKVIGIDISEKALQIAGRKISLHKIDENRVELIQISDSDTRIPLDDNSVDYVYCGGVLMHTSNPLEILKEFYRILKRGGSACIMVYNCDSVFLHLYVAYYMKIIKKRFFDLSVMEAFSKSTDGENCPIARCYNPEDFILLCKNAGFNGEFAGGYFSRKELLIWKKFGRIALKDDRLAKEHKDFLMRLVVDDTGFPTYKGKYAGAGGVYYLHKS